MSLCSSFVTFFGRICRGRKKNLVKFVLTDAAQFIFKTSVYSDYVGHISSYFAVFGLCHLSFLRFSPFTTLPKRAVL